MQSGTCLKRVVIESPWRGTTNEEHRRNIKYAKKCLRHSLSLHEAPIASHLLYANSRILNDNDKEQRNLGIECGLAWGECCDIWAFYVDYGLSPGMLLALQVATKLKKHIEFRTILRRNK